MAPQSGVIARTEQKKLPGKTAKSGLPRFSVTGRPSIPGRSFLAPRRERPFPRSAPAPETRPARERHLYARIARPRSPSARHFTTIFMAGRGCRKECHGPDARQIKARSPAVAEQRRNICTAAQKSEGIPLTFTRPRRSLAPADRAA